MVLGMSWRLADESEAGDNETCCIRGNFYSIRYHQTCMADEWSLTPPIWESIKVLDLKPGIGIFDNVEAIDNIKQFLSNEQIYKLFHVEFSSESANLEKNELYPIFYKTPEWKSLVKFLNICDIVGSTSLDIFARFTTGQNIELSKLLSSDFVHACWQQIERKLTMHKFERVSYYHNFVNYKLLPLELRKVSNWHLKMPEQYVITRDRLKI